MIIPRPVVKMEIDGSEVSRWNEIEIIRSVDAIASTFNMAYVQGGDPRRANKFPFGVLSECKIYVDDELILTGQIGRPSIDSDDDSYSASVPGASKTGNLAVSSNLVERRHIRDATVKQVLEEVCKPFNIPVQEVGSGAHFSKKIKVFKFEDGESAEDAIKRAASMYGMFVWTGNGEELFVGKPGQGNSIGKLHELGRIGPRGVSGDASALYSDYIVKGATAQDLFGDKPSKGFFRITDPSVPLFRALIIRAKGKATQESMERQARQAMHIHRGKALNAYAGTRSWRRNDGKLWNPGDVVTFEDEVSEVYEDLVISAVSLNLGNSSLSCTLEMKRPEVYDIDKEPSGRKSGSKVGW